MKKPDNKHSSTKKDLIEAFSNYAEKNNKLPTRAELTKLGISSEKVRWHFGTSKDLANSAMKENPKAFENVPKALINEKDRIIQVFTSFIKEARRNPTEAELAKFGITRNKVRHHFINIKGLKQAAAKADPKAFENVLDETIFTKENFNKLEAATRKHQRFMVTSAVAGCKVHPKFYKALQKYCKDQNALLLIIPIKDPAAKVNSLDGWQLDPVLRRNGEQIVFGDLALNNNIYISGIQLGAKQIDPVTGLNRLGHSRSFIYGSPKMRMKVLANSNFKLPHVSMSTGAITIPDYDTERYMSQRTAYLADFDHKMGAIIVELDDNDMYYFRQIQAEPKTGNFVDLGTYYKGDGSVGRKEAEVFSLGDIHPGEHDPLALKVWHEVIQITRPKYTILHDSFNGKSVSHYTRGQVVTRALQHADKDTNLSAELDLTASVIAMIASWTTKGTVIARSNHDDWLMEYLQSASFVHDRENFFTAVDLLAAIRRGSDALRFGIESRLKNAKVLDKIIWLKRDEDFRIAGIEYSCHGDRGLNGARRATLKSLGEAYGPIVVGHSHSPGIDRDAWQNGTSTHLQLDYNFGASSWMQSSTLGYDNGSRQMIHCIRGKWRLEKKRKK